MRSKFSLAATLVSLACMAASANAAPVTIQPGDGKDAEINTRFPGSPQGNYAELIINWFLHERSIGLIEFDLGAYLGGTVSSASLSLFHFLNSSLGTTYQAFRITSAWNEATVTYNTAPTFDATPVASLTIADAGSFTYRDWDVTAVVNGWLSGAYANYGLWIEEVPIQGTGVAFFASSDGRAEQDPILRMDYTAPTQVPEPGTLLLVASALLGAAATRRRRS